MTLTEDQQERYGMIAANIFDAEDDCAVGSFKAATAVAESARKDLIEEMIEHCGDVESLLYPFVFPDELEAWLRSYLPAEATDQ